MDRIYFYCRVAHKWQAGQCSHWRCKRASYFPLTPALEQEQAP